MHNVPTEYGIAPNSQWFNFTNVRLIQIFHENNARENMDDGGMKNLDLELIQFLVQVIQNEISSVHTFISYINL